MKWFDKLKESVKNSEKELEDRTTEAIDNAELDNSPTHLREHKGVPLHDKWRDTK